MWFVPHNILESLSILLIGLMQDGRIAQKREAQHSCECIQTYTLCGESPRVSSPRWSSLLVYESQPLKSSLLISVTLVTPPSEVLAILNS